ncbi:LytR/AlgR family response regulator transcription factor [Kordia jejudonensis]|uniref:LytR/AlgR family response regulator transcription factor n=1 Tax=Kordia jejudonensis TaxID=1348245 RepID=UPI0006290FCA|nr:LytTR family DNA-binding domain-containing protein [Kordia jejudonensis]
MIQVENNTTNTSEIHYNNEYICLGSKHKGQYVLKQHILFVEAYENYAWLYLNDNTKRLSSKPIGYYEDLLASDGFTRIHRSYLINISYLKLYERKYRLVHLRGAITLPVSHRKKHTFSKYLQSA